MVTFPIDPFLVDSDLIPIKEKLHEFVEGLVTWQPKTLQTGVYSPPIVYIEARDDESALDMMNRRFLMNT